MRQNPFQSPFFYYYYVFLYQFSFWRVMSTVSMRTNFFFCLSREVSECVRTAETEREQESWGCIRCFRILVIIYLIVWVQATFSFSVFHSPKLGHTNWCNKFFSRYFYATQKIPLFCYQCITLYRNRTSARI